MCRFDCTIDFWPGSFFHVKGHLSHSVRHTLLTCTQYVFAILASKNLLLFMGWSSLFVFKFSLLLLFLLLKWIRFTAVANARFDVKYAGMQRIQFDEWKIFAKNIGNKSKRIIVVSMWIQILCGLTLWSWINLMHWRTTASEFWNFSISENEEIVVRVFCERP